jgi:hypothetical protein
MTDIFVLFLSQSGSVDMDHAWRALIEYNQLRYANIHPNRRQALIDTGVRRPQPGLIQVTLANHKTDPRLLNVQLNVAPYVAEESNEMASNQLRVRAFSPLEAERIRAANARFELSWFSDDWKKFAADFAAELWDQVEVVQGVARTLVALTNGVPLIRGEEEFSLEEPDDRAPRDALAQILS